MTKERVKALKWGKQNEQVAINAYEIYNRNKGYKVLKTGFVVDI